MSGKLFNKLRTNFEQMCAELPDTRRPGHNLRYAIADFMKCAFAVFFFQHQSLLHFQRHGTIGKVPGIGRRRAAGHGRSLVPFIGKHLCRQVQEAGYGFIFTCKNKIHQWLTETVKNSEQGEWNGRHHLVYTCRWVNGVPIRYTEDEEQALLVLQKKKGIRFNEVIIDSMTAIISGWNWRQTITYR